jgi:hypothetical protein
MLKFWVWLYIDAYEGLKFKRILNDFLIGLCTIILVMTFFILQLKIL